VRAVYRGERTVEVAQAPASMAATQSSNPRRRGEGKASAALEHLPEEVRMRFERLRAWRRDRAAEQRVPPYVIFQDRTLLEIARINPARLPELAPVPGVGEAKMARYGEAVLKALAA
jgi:ATP-dependent DNA helicase RecQ